VVPGREDTGHWSRQRPDSIVAASTRQTLGHARRPVVEDNGAGVLSDQPNLGVFEHGRDDQALFNTYLELLWVDNPLEARFGGTNAPTALWNVSAQTEVSVRHSSAPQSFPLAKSQIVK
jgi:hypothetical protein